MKLKRYAKKANKALGVRIINIRLSECMKFIFGNPNMNGIDIFQASINGYENIAMKQNRTSSPVNKLSTA